MNNEDASISCVNLVGWLTPWIEPITDALDLSNLGAGGSAATGAGHDDEAAEAVGMDLSLMGSGSSGSGVGKAGGCVFQRAKCMGVHFAGAYFMSLPLQVLTAPEVRLEI